MVGSFDVNAAVGWAGLVLAIIALPPSWSRISRLHGRYSAWKEARSTDAFWLVEWNVLNESITITNPSPFTIRDASVYWENISGWFTAFDFTVEGGGSLTYTLTHATDPPADGWGDLAEPAIRVLHEGLRFTWRSRGRSPMAPFWQRILVGPVAREESIRAFMITDDARRSVAARNRMFLRGGVVMGTEEYDEFMRYYGA